MRIGWELQSAARGRDSFLGVFDAEHIFGRSATARGEAPFKQWSNLRIDRDREAGCGLMAESCDRVALPVNVTPSQRSSFNSAESGQSQEFDKVGALVFGVAERLCANTCDDLLEFIEARCSTNRFVALRPFQGRRR